MRFTRFIENMVRRHMISALELRGVISLLKQMQYRFAVNFGTLSKVGDQSLQRNIQILYDTARSAYFGKRVWILSSTSDVRLKSNGGCFPIKKLRCKYACIQ